MSETPLMPKSGSGESKTQEQQQGGAAASTSSGGASATAKDPNAPTHREIAVLDPAGNIAANFCGNGVATAKYTFYPHLRFFFWYNLFEQFHKAANIYFLLISGLQLIPGLSPTGRFTTLLPLSFVLSVTMAKDVYEDVKRHRSDRELNNTNTVVWKSGHWENVLWSEVVVGDLVKIKKGHSIPADLVLVWSPEPEGMAYIETASLDGETNLKIRKSPHAMYKVYNPSHPDGMVGRIVCELPNNRLYNFDGYYEKPGRGKVSLTADNILLRGAELRNTREAIGICVFTGADTKLMKNSSAKASKMSTVDRVTNKQILLMFLMLLGLCLGCTIGAAATSTKVEEHWYIPSVGGATDSLVVAVFASFGTFLILFNNLIPISLYVTMEMVKLIQATLINSDVEMYDRLSNCPAIALTSSLNEELGQVEYIFSDKTGTLTCNMMDFLKFTCAKYDVNQAKEVIVSYGTGTTEIGRAAAEREGRVLRDDRPAGFHAVDGFSFYDPRINDLQWTKEDNTEQLELFFLFLAVCHSVVPERQDDGSIVYQAASPDEGCLVKAARDFGVVFSDRTEKSIVVDLNGRMVKYDVLAEIEFNSTRKRMSIIVQDPKGRILLLCKGADTVIYSRLRKEMRGTLQSDTLDLLTKFAAEGLRTLVLSKAELDEGTFARWEKRWHEANTSIIDRQTKMDAVAEEIERELELVGTTAIEDKLQEQVPATIELLATAGIKIWVLTGDKQETAVNIGFACALLHSEMGLFMFDDCNRLNIAKVLQCYVSDAKLVTNQDLGLVVQGDILEYILPQEKEGSRRESELFLGLATRCKAVICCRVSPLQKAKVVSLVKSNMHTVTLAIGDGANDVSMIQAAHVGIGISGLEGLQAARASDYSIAQFRFLQRLLLVHGRYSYRRISKLILYCFYKNVSLFLTQFWFTLFNLFTGQSLYDQWSLSLYNLVFTSVPVVVLAVLDKDVKVDKLLSKDQFPELYHDGMKSTLFNTMAFWMYTINSIVHSLIGFIIPLYVCEFLENTEGQAMAMVGTGAACYTVILIVVTFKISLETQTWTVPNLVVNILSVAMWYVFLGIYGNIFAWWKINDFAKWYGMPAQMLGHPVYWFVIFITPAICLLRELCWKVWKHNYSQRLMHIVQEFDAQGKKFTRRDILRVAPHLLPKFQALKPYEPQREESVFGDVELDMPSVSVTGMKKSISQKLYLQDQAPKSAENVSRAPLTGSYFSQPGKVKIRDVILDEL